MELLCEQGQTRMSFTILYTLLAFLILIILFFVMFSMNGLKSRARWRSGRTRLPRSAGRRSILDVSGTNFLPLFGEQDHNDQQNEGPTYAINHFIG
jgi:hypothetical protein